MTAAALLALGSVAIIGWTVVSLASKPEAVGTQRVPHRLPFSLVRWRCHQPERCVGLGLPNEVRGERRSRSAGHHACSRRPSPPQQSRRLQPRKRRGHGSGLRRRRRPRLDPRHRKAQDPTPLPSLPTRRGPASKREASRTAGSPQPARLPRPHRALRTSMDPHPIRSRSSQTTTSRQTDDGKTPPRGTGLPRAPAGSPRFCLWNPSCAPALQKGRYQMKTLGWKRWGVGRELIGALALGGCSGMHEQTWTMSTT